MQTTEKYLRSSVGSTCQLVILPDMTTNSIRKTETGQWAIETRRVFTNHRLVRQGGESYTDSESHTHYFRTRKQAVAFAEKCIESGWTASFLRNGLVLSIDLTNVEAAA